MGYGGRIHLSVSVVLPIPRKAGEIGEEIERLKELKDEDDVWQEVEAYLGFAKQEEGKAERNRRSDFERRRIRREEGEKKKCFDTLGYFAIVGLARVQCSSGDYELSLKTPMLDLQKKFTRIPGCTFLSIITLVSRISCSIGKDAAKFFNQYLHVEHFQMNLRRRKTAVEAEEYWFASRRRIELCGKNLNKCFHY